MSPANTYGRQTVLSAVNKSGGALAAGDVCTVDTSNDNAITTTTTGRSEVSVGVVQEAIANNATGRVAVSGYVGLINVPASVTRGHYIETHTVAKQATGNSTRRSGSFGQFWTGGTTPTGWLWGSTDQTASGGSTSARAARANRTSGNISMTTSGWKDVDTGLDLVLAASSGEWIEVGLSAFAASELQNAGLDMATIVSASPVNYISGSGGGGASYFGVQGWLCSDVGATSIGCSVIYQLVSGDLSGGNVTLRLRYRAAGTKTLVAGTNQPLTVWARVLGT